MHQKRFNFNNLNWRKFGQELGNSNAKQVKQRERDGLRNHSKPLSYQKWSVALAATGSVALLVDRLGSIVEDRRESA